MLRKPYINQEVIYDLGETLHFTHCGFIFPQGLN